MAFFDTEEGVEDWAHMDGAERDAIDGAQQRVDDARDEKLGVLRQLYLDQLVDALQMWLDGVRNEMKLHGDDDPNPEEAVALTLTLN